MSRLGLQAVFGDSTPTKSKQSPPSLDSTPRRPALKGARSPYFDEERAGSGAFDTPSRPLTAAATPPTKSFSWSKQLVQVHRVHDTTYRTRSWIERNPCLATWAVVGAGFTLLFLVALIYCEEPVR